MKKSYPHYQTSHGYLTEKIKQKYIRFAIEQRLLPENAHRIESIISLNACHDENQPIQFWQLFSVLGTERIVKIVQNFYQRVYSDEAWFSSVFARISDINHHINAQASMWVDVMGGGMMYHGGEYRLSFHHTHNAMALMNQKGAERWVKLMCETLNDPSVDMTNDPRVRPCLNTFLSYFLDKYADEFNFEAKEKFGVLNSAYKRRINFMKMTSDDIEALSEAELRGALQSRGIDVSELTDKVKLVSKALSL